MELASIGELVVQCALEIAEKVLDSEPMLRPWIGIEPGKIVDCKLDVRAVK